MGYLRNILKAKKFRRKCRKFSSLFGPADSPLMLRVESQRLERREQYRIAFVVPDLAAFSGGHTSILRLGTYLAGFGHEIFYVTNADGEVGHMARNAAANLPGYQGTILPKSALARERFDVGVATKWDTCFTLLRSPECFGYKMYFVQDFEPYFYPVGDHYLLALNTYRAGFHMVSLGVWNKAMIERVAPKVRVEAIDFPLETRQYPRQSRTIEIGDRVVLAVYLKPDDKRAPLLIMESLRRLERALPASGRSVEINVFGLGDHRPLPVGRNLGQLTPNQLGTLYARSHFGLVGSLSNISLVNFEMIATGLPVIDFKDGSAPYYFGPHEMIFLDFDPGDLTRRVMYFLQHQDELNALLARAQAALGEKTWENSARQFDHLLRAAAG